MAKKNRRPSGPRTARPGTTRPSARPATGAPSAGGPSASGAQKPKRAAVEYVARPFEGLPSEADSVAMREIVPAATASVTTTAEHGSREVTIVTLLPDLVPALRREDGEVLVALQTVGGSGDASRDVAHALLKALDLEPGEALRDNDLPEPGPRLQDILAEGDFTPAVLDGFDFWVSEAEREGEVAQALEQANEQVVPTLAVPVPDGLGSAFWCRMNGKEFLRWVVPAAEEETLDALARLHAKRASALEDGARLIGAFRTCGVLVPVWELVRGTEADELAAPVATLGQALATALATTDPLSPQERSARSGLVARQVNLR